MDIKAFMGLSKKPRIVELFSVVDGSTRSFKDDGGAVVDGVVYPNAHRQRLESAVKKKSKKGVQIFYVKKALAALYPGDPLAEAKVFDKAAQKVLDDNLASRKRRDDATEQRAKGEAAKHLAVATKNAVAQGLVPDSAAAQASPDGGSNGK